MMRIAKLTGLVAALVVALLAVWACTVNPATGERQLTLVGEGQALQMGREADEQIVAQMGLYEDDELQRYVQRVGEELAAVSERSELEWHFKVIDDDVVNAFALPGGFIYVTRGILAHFDSEAELAAVLGHEIGHVTGRHTVERLSKTQLAQVGLGIGMIASEDVRQFGDLAQAGLGLLFLKYSRDDERQADDLGLRYMSRRNYAPTEMADVFTTLDRVGESQGQSIPGWLSTHPAPANRRQRILDDIASMRTEVDVGEIVNRDVYLRSIDGVVFGKDPRQGFFREERFYHPELQFQLRFPDGWETVNQRSVVGAVSPDQDAAIELRLVGEETSSAAARAFFAREGVERGRSRGSGLFDFRTDPINQAGDRIRGVASFVEHRGRVYRLLGYSLDDRWDRYDRATTASLTSFDQLTERRYLDVQPARVDVVSLDRSMTLAQFAQRHPSTVDMETLAILNGVEEDTRLEAGRMVKRVVGGELP